MPLSLSLRPGPVVTLRCIVARRLRGFRYRVERARIATRIGELRDLVDVPHDLAEAARARIERLSRRERALFRVINEVARP